MVQTEVPFDTIADAIQGTNSIEESDITNDYSGRGMFGDECFGITAPEQSELTLFFIGLADIDADLARDLANNMRIDSMGMGMIAYFPSYTLTDVPDEVE